MSANLNPEPQVGQAILERFEAGEIFIPFDQLTWFDVAGEDRQKVLGNLTTNNIARLDDGHGCETFITDVRGKTFGHAIVYCVADRLRVVTVADQYQRMAAHIDRYVVREDVQTIDRSDDFYAVFWPGVAGCKVAKRFGFVPLARPLLRCTPIAAEGIDAVAYQVPWTRAGDWLIAVPHGQSEALESWLIGEDILPGHRSLMHCGRISNRYPWFGVDMDENNLPQEMDRDDRTIDFRKGCYLGQETVARLDATGQVQKKLMLWRFDGYAVPPRGLQLRSGDKVVATVTSGTYCFGHEAPLALAVTRRSHFADGSTAESDIGTARVIH